MNLHRHLSHLAHCHDRILYTQKQNQEDRLSHSCFLQYAVIFVWLICSFRTSANNDKKMVSVPRVTNYHLLLMIFKQFLSPIFAPRLK